MSVGMKQGAPAAAPDGGWGYLIWVSVIINYMNATIFTTCFGLIFGELTAEVRLDAAELALLSGCCAFLMALAGYVTGPLLKRFSLRQLAAAGAALVSLGGLGACFSADRVSFYFVRIIQSMGTGVLFITSNTVLIEYWLKKRLLAVSFTQAVLAVWGLLAPRAVSWLRAEYGPRGTLLLLAGLGLHSFVAAALMRPVEWRAQLVDDNEDHKKLFPTAEIPAKTKCGRSAMDLEHQTAPTDVPNTLVRRVAAFMDARLLRDARVLSACVGVAACLFSDRYYGLELPRALLLAHWTESAVSWALMMAGYGDLAMKVVLMLLSKCLAKVTSRTLYMGGILLAIFSRLGMLGSASERAVVGYLTLLGAGRSVLGALPPLVLAECAHQRHFASVNGLMMLLVGVNGLVLGPLLGAVSDISGNFASSFYIMTSFFGVVLMFWCIELCYLDNQARERARAANKTRR